MDHEPDNHFTRRADDRLAQGLTPERPAAWPMVVAAIAAWALSVTLFALLALPFLQWGIDHWSKAR